jgi:hypothetical protein
MFEYNREHLIHFPPPKASKVEAKMRFNWTHCGTTKFKIASKTNKELPCFTSHKNKIQNKVLVSNQ